MRIIVQERDEPIEQTENPGVTLIDDGFNVPGWVNIKVDDKSADVHLDELYHAVLALWSKYRDELSKDTPHE